MKQGFGGLFERKWRNHLLCFKKISNRMLHKSVSFHLRFNILLVPGFAMSSVRFIVPRKPCQCRTALPIIWSVSNISVLRLGSRDLALNSWACHGVIWCLPLLLCAPGHCLYLHDTEFWCFWWEKRDPGAAGRGNLEDSLSWKIFQHQKPCAQGKGAYKLRHSLIQ